VAAQDLVLVLDVGEAAADVAGVSVASHDPQGHPLASSADQDRKARLDRCRQVERFAGGVEA
jgi:hypothetical protein